MKRGGLPDHRGRATWGERLVGLDEFRRAAAAAGRELDADERVAASRRLLAPIEDGLLVEGPFERIAVFGGVYSNHLALAALLERLERDRVDAVYALGDLGGFGPCPEKVWPLLKAGRVLAIQGNYEQSLAAGAADCNCGYTDPRDNQFAALSYAYTAAGCSAAFRAWMGALPRHRRLRIGSCEFLLVHGSPRRVNEFLFDSTSPDSFLELLCRRHRAAGLLCTHTGLHWQRRLPSGRTVANVGALGRPANDGRTEVWYALVTATADGPVVEHVPLRYDHPALAREMRAEGLPEEFVATILGGWWTSCLEILPARERAAGRY